MLDCMFRERSREEDAILNLESELKKYRSEIKSEEDARVREISDLSEQIKNTTKEELDLSFIEKGLYIQMLVLVGRTKDAKEAAKDWVQKYEEVNITKEPSLENKKTLDGCIKELKVELEKAKKNG